jgi:hypothetical protein
MPVADLVGHLPPALLVDLGEVRLVLGDDDPHRRAARDDDVRSEMAERPMRRVGPVELRDGLATTRDPQRAAGHAHVFSDDRRDVILPQPIERQAPGEAVHLLPPLEAAFVSDPADRVEAVPDGVLQERIAGRHAREHLRTRVNARDVRQLVIKTGGKAESLHSHGGCRPRGTAEGSCDGDVRAMARTPDSWTQDPRSWADPADRVELVLDPRSSGRTEVRHPPAINLRDNHLLLKRDKESRAKLKLT